MNFKGVWTALATPFDVSGKVDLEAFRGILRDQKLSGVAGVIVSGTTGESPTTSIDEKRLLLKTALEELKGSSTRVMAGTGSYNTAETIEHSRWASEQGVAGLLIVTPYYNRPTQAGLKSHFQAVADQVSCPIMLYNVPGRTGTALTPETIAALAKHPKIRAIKEASGSVTLISEIQDQLNLAGAQIEILTGDDLMFLPTLSVGAIGVVSVASNLFPRGVVSIQSAWDRGDHAEALRIHQRYFPMFRDLFIESNPSPLKAALKWAGWCQAEVRAPLAPMSESNLAKLESTLKSCKIHPGKQPN